jgi:Raf kinase inhibitor-like YbhB/YbcL family protein
VELTSPAFGDGEPVPPKHTCDGDDVSPALAWADPPEGTVSVALCLDDPDAGRYPFTHWLAWSLPAVGSLGEGEAAPAEGRNDFGAPGYRGPCPPPGKPHRYVFTVCALDAQPQLGPIDRRLSFDKAIDGHVLATAALTGTYRR